MLSQDTLTSTDGPHLPAECALLAPPLLQRQVWLRAGGSSGGPAAGQPLVYACSWWNAAAFGAAMPSQAAPIWRNLAAQRTEAYRDLRCVVLGDAPPQMEASFGKGGPFWGRHYVLYSGGVPLTVIYEVFSPRLATWCGQQDGRG